MSHNRGIAPSVLVGSETSTKDSLTSHRAAAAAAAIAAAVVVVVYLRPDLDTGRPVTGSTVELLARPRDPRGDPAVIVGGRIPLTTPEVVGTGFRLGTGNTYTKMSDKNEL